MTMPTIRRRLSIFPIPKNLNIRNNKQAEAKINPCFRLLKIIVIVKNTHTKNNPKAKGNIPKVFGSTK